MECLACRASALKLSCAAASRRCCRRRGRGRNANGDVMRVRRLILAAAVVLAGLCASRGALAQGAFTLSSPDFKDGERLPLKNAGNRKGAANCVGENFSPALNWAIPAGRHQELRAPDVRSGGAPAERRHSLGGQRIPASATGLAEGEMSRPSDKYVDRPRGCCFGTSAFSRPPCCITRLDAVATDLESRSAA